jgi:hypothetical protein
VADKQLTEPAWKAFAKGKSYKDDALIKALGMLAKAEKLGPSDQLDALDDIDKQAEVLRKAHKGDKELSAYLDGLSKASERQRKESIAAQKAAEKTQAENDKGSDADDEADAPDLLTTKMVPLIRALRAGKETMHGMVCTAGRNTAVLIMRRPIGPPRRKLLLEAVDAQAGAKYHVAQCSFADGKLTFAMPTAVSGLAKRISAALLSQTGLRLRVCVRTDEGEESDGEDEGDAVVQAPDGGTGAPQEPPSPARLAHLKRLEELKPLIAQAIKAQHPETSKIRALLAFAIEKADVQNDLTAAGKSLDALTKLLGATGDTGKTATPDTPAEPKGPDPAAAFNARLSALIPAVKDATTRGHPQAEAAKLKASEAGVFARKRDFEAAGALLDELEGLLSQPAPQEGNTEPEGEDEPTAESLALDRFNRLGIALRKLEKHPDFPSLRERFTAAARARNAKEFDQLTELLDAIEPDIRKALSDQLDQAANGKDGPSLRKVAMASLAWQQACQQARRDVESIKAAVIAELEAEEEYSAEELDAVRNEMERLDSVFKVLDASVTDAFDAAIKLKAEQRKPVLQKLTGLLDQTQNGITGNEVFNAIRNNGFHDADPASPALAALGSLREAIESLLKD